MELQFEKTVCHCLDRVVREVQNQEQTQELKLTDGMPDIGRVIGSWGQVILRSKEWRGDCIAFSGGIMVWVLYAPEDGTDIRCLDTWIPFQMKWDLPTGVKEGDIRIGCLLRFTDARSVSPRKIMIRAGVAAMADALSPMEADICIPGQVPEDVELLRRTYPVRLPREAGEKAFLLDEDLTLPGSCPTPEKILYYSLNPQVTDRKVMANKVVFRGNGNLHVVYKSDEGQLHSWDFELPFSQLSDLDGEYSPDAQVDVTMCVTNLEMELDDESHMRPKCGIVAQYVVNDRQILELIEDAYSPSREIGMDAQGLELPIQLDSRTENIYGEQTIQGDANVIVDASFLPDYPRQRRTEVGVELEIPGLFQVLYYGEDGMLRSGTARWEGSWSIPADGDSRISADIIPMGIPQASIGDGRIEMKTEVPIKLETTGNQGLPMVSGLEIGEQQEPDASRPSVILRKAGEDRLWNIAKDCGSTVAAIRAANGLQEEPAADQMLLIPVS